MLKNFMANLNILKTFRIFYDLLVHFVLIWYMFSFFGVMHQKISGNPAEMSGPAAGGGGVDAFSVSKSGAKKSFRLCRI
jgi:hypothetical protein